MIEYLSDKFLEKKSPKNIITTCIYIELIFLKNPYHQEKKKINK